VVCAFGQELPVLFERVVLAVEEVLHVPPDNALSPYCEAKTSQDEKKEHRIFHDSF
jgi:hypothetical protein